MLFISPGATTSTSFITVDRQKKGTQSPTSWSTSGKKRFHVSRNRTLMFLHNPVDDTENGLKTILLTSSDSLLWWALLNVKFLLELSISRCFIPGLVLQAECDAAQAGTGPLWAAYHANVASFLDMLWGEGRVFIHIHRERMSERQS